MCVWVAHQPEQANQVGLGAVVWEPPNVRIRSYTNKIKSAHYIEIDQLVRLRRERTEQNEIFTEDVKEGSKIGRFYGF